MAVDLLLLYPPFREAVAATLKDLADDGYDFVPTAGLRRFDEQDKLYAQGRTAPGNIVTKAKGGESLHNYGLALDLARRINGKIVWAEDKYAIIGQYARQHGLKWGGDWKTFKDLPHIEYDLAAHDLKLRDLLKVHQKDGLPGVWKLIDVTKA